MFVYYKKMYVIPILDTCICARSEKSEAISSESLFLVCLVNQTWSSFLIRYTIFKFEYVTLKQIQT